MKKLLTIITLSALVGTSASNLESVFTSSIINYSFKSKQINNKEISIQNQNNTNPFEPAQINNSIIYKSIKIMYYNKLGIFAVFENNFYKSTDGINFDKIEIHNITGIIQSVSNAPDGTIWVGTTDGLFKSTDGINFDKIEKVRIGINVVKVAQNGDIYLGINIKEEGALVKSTDNGVSFPRQKGDFGFINSISISSTGDVYLADKYDLRILKSGTDNWKSTNMNAKTNTVTICPDGTIYAGNDNGTFLINPINLLLNIHKPDTFDKTWPVYSGIVYNSVQKIDIKDNLVASATLDESSITIPNKNLNISVGEHTLILTLKDKKFASVFGGDPNTGQVIYKLWVKTAIDKNKIDYQTKIDDTQLYTGLVSNAGNTNNADIIQTKIKDGTGTHDASLNIDFKDILIDFDVNKSFYEQGTIDETTNNFTATGSKQKITKNLSIQTDGIYHLHLEDTAKNTYDSYLEIGESNWKLKGTFDDSELDKLKSKLNVTVNLTDPSQKSKAMGWLNQYENEIDKQFLNAVATNGKGFDSDIKKDITSYTSFLKPLIYDIANEPKFDDGIDKIVLLKTITEKADELLKNGLSGLPKNLNVDTKNVVNKSTLDHYTNWINNYQTFINKNKDKWINDIANIASRGFATNEQENQIKAQLIQFLNNDNIKKYLKNVVWQDSSLLKATSNDYQQYIELDKLQTDTINWVNTNMSEINIAYQNAIAQAESRLNLHGYSIETILNGKAKPQTKDEIEKFAYGQSYHDWLQSQANIKFHGWQITMGLSIGIPLLLIAVIVGCFIYRRTNPKYHGYWRGKKEAKLRKSNFKKNDKNDNKSD